jgi:hypothetical protein
MGKISVFITDVERISAGMHIHLYNGSQWKNRLWVREFRYMDTFSRTDPIHKIGTCCIGKDPNIYQ